MIRPSRVRMATLSLLMIAATPTTLCMASPAAAQAQTFSWAGTWAFSADDDVNRNPYVKFTLTNGKLSGVVWVKTAIGIDEAATITLDFERSTNDRLVGSYIQNGSSVVTPVEFVGDKVGGFATMLTKVGVDTRAVYLRRVAKVGDPFPATTGPALRRAMLGAWDTSLGPLTIVEEVGRLLGTITRAGTNTVLHSIEAENVFTSEMQKWYIPGSRNRDSFVQIVLSPNGREFHATAEGELEAPGGLRKWDGTRTTAGTAPRPAPPPAYAAGIYDLIGRWYSPFGPINFHKPASGQARVVSTINGGASGGTYDVDVLGAVRQNTFGGNWRSFGTATQATGDIEFEITDEGRTLRAVEVGSGSGILGRREWTASRTAAIPAPAPQPAPPPPTAPPPPPVVQPPRPPVQPPSSPPVVQPPIPAPGTLPLGVFHQMEGFDIRVDEVRAARDGKLHLFLTAANKSGQPRSIGQGTFAAVMSDADGVGVHTETVWRATGEELRTFDVPPTVPAGGEMKIRLVMEPPRVHGPLARIGLREGKGKVLFFGAGGSDTRSDASAPPPIGSGAFKQFSKLDARIDRAGAARDGRFEVFITFRNPTREPQAVNAAAQRLMGTNSDGASVTARYALYSVRGERGENDALPVPVYVEAGGETRVRYVFDDAPRGALTITDGTVTQTFTPGG